MKLKQTLGISNVRPNYVVVNESCYHLLMQWRISDMTRPKAVWGIEVPSVVQGRTPS